MAFGVDISDNNTVLNWSQLAANVDFLWIKLNQGTSIKYPSGIEQWHCAWQYKIPSGPYHFAELSADPIASAQAFASCCEAVGALHATQWNLIPCIDMETNGSSPATNWLKAFEAAFRSKTSYTGEFMIYASLSQFKDGNILVQPTWQTWVAEWNNLPSTCSWPGASIHQYTANAPVPGVTDVDGDYALVPLDTFTIHA